MEKFKSWKEYSDEELLDLLKKEIYRLGIQDNPSRTRLQKMYDNKNMPSPNNYKFRFGSWEEIMEKIGLSYSGKKSQSDQTSQKNSGKRNAATWANMSREDVLEAIFKTINDNDIRTNEEYVQNRDRKNSPALATIYQVIGSWKEVKEAYYKKYGKMLGGDMDKGGR